MYSYVCTLLLKDVLTEVLCPVYLVAIPYSSPEVYLNSSCSNAVVHASLLSAADIELRA